MSIPPPPGPQQPQDPQGPYPQGQYGQYPYAAPGAYPQSPPGYPYQPWGHGYTPYGQPPPVNGVAIASLVLGILCCVPGVGLVLGLVALAQMRRKGERGRGMAVAGSALSAFGLTLWVLALATGGLTDAWGGLKDTARDNGSVYTLTKGECFDAPSGSLEGFAYDVDEVTCAGEHDGEVFAAVRMTGYADSDAYPGDDKVTDTADTRCYALRYDYAMDLWAVPDYVDIYYLTPTRDSWRLGDREITCVFGNTDETASLTGSLRNDAASLDADQHAYLAAVNIGNRAMDTQPVDSPDDDLAANRKWADRMATALTQETRQLRGHRWPAGVDKPVGKVAAELGTIQKEWARAATAEDADAFYVSYDRILTLSTTDRSLTAREALGLATTPPSYGDAGGGGGDGEGDSGLEV
ncbi:DUF4190 domain-containing protein [Streptomyces pseudovenezuelae]|uniref:Type IV secretory pathway TrbD component n=1 Tax=Streptomyces pseudovenezuelae TaxID=67350 RepID=A0ABT6LV04_9ACTN|nr:DUF4190 domain-containing protein [Streptomyces pseudovenezuelae]MDH6220145.1 type IV secretory pathway TrbD component [Streptomyces pseudovenezuelae]